MKLKIITVAGGKTFETEEPIMFAGDAPEPHLVTIGVISAVQAIMNGVQNANMGLESLTITVVS